MTRTTRRRFVTTSLAAGGLALAGCIGDDDPPNDITDDPDEDDDPDPPADDDDEVEDDTDPEPDPEPEAGYEIWALDQGTDTVYIYEPDDDDFVLIDELDTGQHGGDVPHMISFSSDYAYAAIACTAGARTLVYRTEDRELVANLETGPGSHFAGFAPGDDYIHVDVIGAGEVVRIAADLEAETFESTDAIEVLADDTVQAAGIDSGAPVCHSYDHAGRSLHTLGPGYPDGALVIIDHDTFTVETAIPGDELPTNCGTMPHPTEDKFYLTAGQPSDPDADADGVGAYYVLDTATDTVITQGDTNGIDAHGFWFTPDAAELWVLNRETNNGVVIDPTTDEVIDDIPAFGPADGDTPEDSDAPDILWASPDGAYMFATLRGPAPLSGDPHAATGVTPGFSVLDTATREIVTVIEPDPIAEYTPEDIEDDDTPIPDFHGIGVRPIREFDALTSPPY